MKNEEWLPLVTADGKIKGKATRSEIHSGSMLLHPVVHMHVLHDSGRILLQKRPLNKLVQPGKWDTAVGGHIAAGESLEKALERETAEETGITGFTPKLLAVYQWETEIEKELVYMFLTRHNHHILKGSDEVDELKYWDTEQIDAMLGSGVFTPNFEYEYQILKSSGMLQ